MTVKFVIPGDPKGKGRHRTTKSGHTYTPAETTNYENLVKLMYYQHCRNFKFDDNAQLDVRIIAYFPIPKSKSKKVQEAMRTLSFLKTLATLRKIQTAPTIRK